LAVNNLHEIELLINGKVKMPPELKKTKPTTTTTT
jgi:hypothetical protein